MSTQYGGSLTAATLRRHRQRILAGDDVDLDTDSSEEDEAVDDDEDEDADNAESTELMEADDDSDDDDSDDSDDDEDEDDDSDDDDVEGMGIHGDDDSDDDSDDDDSDDDDSDDDDDDDADLDGVNGSDDSDDSDDDDSDDEDVTGGNASLVAMDDDDDDDDDADDDEACGDDRYAEGDDDSDDSDDDDSDDDEDVTGGNMSLLAEDDDEDSGDEDDEDDEDSDSDAAEGNTYAEDDDDDDDDDDDAEDAEGTSSGPTTRNLGSLKPGVPAQNTFFGPPPDAGSSYANFHCAGCGFEGLATQPKTATAKGDRKGMQRHISALAADYGLDIELVRTASGYDVRLLEGTGKMFNELVNAIGGSYEISAMDEEDDYDEDMEDDGGSDDAEGATRSPSQGRDPEVEKRKIRQNKAKALAKEKAWKAKNKGKGGPPQGKPRNAFSVSAASNALNCPCCSTPMSVSAHVRTASLVGMELDLKPVGRCKSHGTMYASSNEDTHLYCTLCASETISEGDEIVSIPVASPTEVEQDADAHNKMELSLFNASSQNPFWNVFYAGIPMARIELQAQERPMEIRDLFVTSKYREVTTQAMRRFGVHVALKTQHAHFYVAEANVAAEMKKANRRIKKASARKMASERDQFANHLLDMIKVAAQGFDKNMFPGEGHAIKEAMADSLAEAGAHDPIAIVEDTFAEGIFESYLANVIAKAMELSDLDPKELRGQVRMIQGATYQEPVPGTQGGRSSQTLSSRLTANSVKVRPSGPVRTSASKESRKSELRQKLNLGGATVR